MLQDVYTRYRGGCMMLVYKSEDTVSFMGTCFLVHPEGYLLTAAHLIHDPKNLMAVPFQGDDGFEQVFSKTVSPLGVDVVQMDRERDVALLKIREPLEISMPDHVLSPADDIAIGTSVAMVSYPFGMQHVYTQVVQHAVISSKILSRNETKLFLVDSMIHRGSKGAPLVNADDGRVIGLVSGLFDPLQAVPYSDSEEPSVNTHLSYAVSIKYAVNLMEKEGLEIF
ncbi:MAG TPA: serine protease [Desulfomicrobiaceae bacterium]|nr:serine protease [Desulfomicrobiaceae bacterium]